MPAINSRCRQWHKPSFLLLDSFRPVFRQVLKSCTFYSLCKEFTDWAFTFMTSFLYYLDYDTIDEQTRSLYRQGISAFGGISTYRIALERIRPLSYGISIRCLSWCRCAFPSCSRTRTVICVCASTVKSLCRKPEGNEFCSQKCKNQFNVYKSRKEREQEMIENRNVNIITDADGKSWS